MELIGTIKAKGALTGYFDFDQADYNLLKNKPSINGVELVGNKTSEDLHIETGGGGTTDYNDLTNKPMINGIGLIDNKTANDLGLQEEIDFPQDPTKYLDGEGNFTTPPYISSYLDLSDKPQINGVTLTGDKSTADLHIDYDDISSHPEINSIELTGDKSGNDLKLTSAAPYSGSGASIHFEADDQYNLLSCEVDFEPDQDLNGYDKPWPPGGGKNQLEVTAISATVNDIIFTVNSDGTIRAQGTASANTNFNIHPTGDLYYTNDNYTLSGCPTGGSATTYCIKEIYSTGEVDTGNGVTRAYTTSEIHRYAIYIASGTSVDLIFKPMVCLATASDPTTFEPYSNICPITGNTSVTINISPTADPSEGQNITVQLGNTYYKGTINITTGKIELTHRMISENDFIAISGGTSAGGLHYVNTNASDPPATTANAISDRLVQNQGGWNSTIPCLTTNTGTAPLIYPVRVYCEESTLIDFKANYSGLQILYELQTPIETAIDPQAISALNGDNYITAGESDLTIEAATQIFDPIIKWLVNNR